MNNIRTYKCLKQQTFESGDCKLVPIRHEDRYPIMKWRNEQIYHLRQAKPLNKEKQDWYFENVVAKLFDQEKPNQLLFSVLKKGECIGYGGLVHINWIDMHAEISFIMNTALEEQHFVTNWEAFLRLIEKVAFQDLKFHKIFTYAFDLRPHLYPALEGVGFKKEAILPEHCFFEERFVDVVIHSKINRKVELRPAKAEDAEVTYKWANDADVRRFALNPKEIPKADHISWFKEKIANPHCLYFIALHNQTKVGSFRLDVNTDSTALISYLLDPAFHGKGLGRVLLKTGVEKAKAHKDIKRIEGYVKEQNRASLHLFRTLGFQEESQELGLFKFQLKVR